jgi:hypothetical protein
MTHRRPRTPEEEDDTTASPEFTRLVVIAFLTAAGLGLLCGVVWVVWHLLGR